MADPIFYSNLATPAQLDVCMNAAIGSLYASPDQWNYCLGNFLHTGTENLPDTNTYLPRDTSAAMTSTEFLTALRTYETALNFGKNLAGNKGGDKPVDGGTSDAKTPVGKGLFGLTDCKVCQQLAANPLVLVFVGLAVWYLVFED